MDDLEKMLESLPLRAPSPDLDRRVMASKPGPQPKRRSRRWLVALATAAALAGGIISWMETPAPAPAAGTRTNPFDFTRPSSIFPPGQMNVVVRSPKGN